MDSAQIWPEIPKQACLLADFGSGGGFPAIVLAIIAKELKPELSLHLVESDQRKAAFLLQCSMELSLNTTIHSKRAENMDSLGADVVSARALSSLGELLEIQALHGNQASIGLFPKGRKHVSELTEAAKKWTFDARNVPSLTDPDGAILIIERVARGEGV